MVTLWPRAAKVFAAARPATPAPIMQTVFCLTIDYPQFEFGGTDGVCDHCGRTEFARACGYPCTIDEPDLQSRPLGVGLFRQKIHFVLCREADYFSHIRKVMELVEQRLQHPGG